MKKKNKYKLDKDAHLMSRRVVTEIAVTYDIPADDIKVVFAKRHDVVDRELQLRIGRQVESALRESFHPYAIELNQVERLARIGADLEINGCDCGEHK